MQDEITHVHMDVEDCRNAFDVSKRNAKECEANTYKMNYWIRHLVT